MGITQNFTIENNNGTDYDTLYPETNSGQILLDSDAQVTTNLPSGSTINDALHNIVKDGGTYQIGDTLTTVRTNLGDKWLLCNGQSISSNKYPALVAQLGTAMFDWHQKGTASISNILDVVNKTTGTGNLFMASQRSSNGYNVYYSTDLLSWSVLRKENKQPSIWCVNGTWIISSESTYVGFNKYVYYSGNDMDSSNFAAISGITKGIYGAAYWNGKYYLSTVDPNLEEKAGSIYLYSDLSLSPSILHLGGTSSGGSYVGSLHVLPEGVAICETSMDVSKFYVSVVNQQEQITRYTVSVPISIRGAEVEYFNKYYYAILRTYASSGNLYRLYRSSSLTGTYSPVKYNGTEIQAKYLTITDDMLITDTGYYITNDNTVHKQSVVVNPTVRILVGKANYYTITDTTVYEALIAEHAQLPSVSVASGLYTYIKAK